MSIPKNLANDTRITRVYIDMPNIVNSLCIEPKNILRTDPYYLDHYKPQTKGGDYLLRVEADDIRKLFELYIDPIERAEITVYTTPKFRQLNNYLIKLNEEYKKQEKEITIALQETSTMATFEKNGKEFTDYMDIDKDMESAMLDDAFEKNIPPNKYNRIIVMSGDKYFVDVLDHYNAHIKIHIVCSMLGMHKNYRRFAQKRNALMRGDRPSNGELNVMYHGFFASDLMSQERLDRYYQRSQAP